MVWGLLRPFQEMNEEAAAGVSQKGLVEDCLLRLPLGILIGRIGLGPRCTLLPVGCTANNVSARSDKVAQRSRTACTFGLSEE